MPANKIFAREACAVMAAALVAVAPLWSLNAQQSNASAAAFGMGGNYTAVARGYNAVAWNPANLGLPGNPGFSLAILAVGGTSGLDPVDASAFNGYAHKFIPLGVREDWLTQVTSKGGETGDADGGVTWLAANFGHLGLQVSSAGYGNAKMNPDAFQALMFGNVGLTGTAQDLHFSGSSFRGGSFTTAAASWGMGFGGDAKSGDAFALGVTGKMVIGHVMAMAQDNGSATTASNINVVFPIVHTNFNASDATNAGNGFGADLGAAWNVSGWRLGAAVMNVFNTFAWDESKLRARAGTATFDGNTNVTHFDTAAFSTAPASLRQAVENNKFKPSVNVGVGYDWTPDITIAADAHQQLADDNSIQIGPKTRAGVGAEYRGLGVLPIRAGVSYITGGMSYSAGVGLHVGSYELGVAGSLASGSTAKGMGVMLSLFSIR